MSRSKNILSLLAAFSRLGLTSFGGPAAHLGYFRQEFVIKRGWFSESDYAQLVAIGQFLPGPASSQVGFAIGLIRAGWLGALTAFFAFTLPSVLIMVAVALTLPNLGNEIALAFIAALKLLACIIVTDAVLGMFRQFCVTIPKATFAIVAFVLLSLFSLNVLMLLVLLVSALVGAWVFTSEQAPQTSQWQSPVPTVTAYVLLVVFSILFVLSLVMSVTPESLGGVFSNFYLTGSLVFGGGHVVLPLLEEQWVATNVISKTDFMSGYGAAQMLPGPLFSFAAYLAALVPGIPASIAVIAALAGIFIPGFLLMAATLSLWLKVSRYDHLRGAVAAVNAAVVGILAAVLLDPVLLTGIQKTTDIVLLLLAVLALQSKKLAMIWVILISLVLHLILSFSGF